MNTKEFHKKFDNTPNEERFQVFNPEPAPTSLFVIFKQLAIARDQKRYFEDREAYLLKIAEKEFKKRENNGY